MPLVHGKVGDGGAEVGAETLHSLGLREAIVTDDVAIALEHSGEAFGLPDVVEVAENGFALAALFLAGEIFAADPQGVVEVTQLVEEAALFGGAEVDAVEGCAEAGSAIMDDEFQAVGPADAGGFQVAEKRQPGALILAVGQVPGQDFGPVAVGPDAQRNQRSGV